MDSQAKALLVAGQEAANLMPDGGRMLAITYATGGITGGRSQAISDEKLNAIVEALNAGASKAAICRTFGVKRSTLYDSLKRKAKEL
jgi:DNA invertase Pin-like site-specific DNA recombinase